MWLYEKPMLKDIKDVDDSNFAVDVMWFKAGFPLGGLERADIVLRISIG